MLLFYSIYYSSQLAACSHLLILLGAESESAATQTKAIHTFQLIIW